LRRTGLGEGRIGKNTPLIVLAVAAFDLGGLILQATFQPARFGLTGQVLPFAVSNLTHGRAAGIAAVVRGGTRRFTRRLVTPGTIAEDFGKILVAA